MFINGKQFSKKVKPIARQVTILIIDHTST